MDDLTRIDGIGKATAKKLGGAGIDSFDKLARFAEFPDLAAKVEVTPEWIAQAKELAGAQSQPINPGVETAEGEGATTDADPDKQSVPGDNAAGPAAQDMETDDAELVAAHPNLAHAVDAWRNAGNTLPPSIIRISAKRDGFRRAGLAHSKAPVEHPVHAFGPAALDMLLGEPNLTVELA